MHSMKMCVRVRARSLQSDHAERHSCTREIRLNKSEILPSFKTLNLFTLLIIVITAASSRWGEKKGRRERKQTNKRQEAEKKEFNKNEKVILASSHLPHCPIRSFLGKTHTFQSSQGDLQHGLTDGRVPSTRH